MFSTRNFFYNRIIIIHQFVMVSIGNLYNRKIFFHDLIFCHKKVFLIHFSLHDCNIVRITKAKDNIPVYNILIVSCIIITSVGFIQNNSVFCLFRKGKNIPFFQDFFYHITDCPYTVNIVLFTDLIAKSRFYSLTDFISPIDNTSRDTAIQQFLKVYLRPYIIFFDVFFSFEVCHIVKVLNHKASYFPEILSCTANLCSKIFDLCHKIFLL